MALTGINAMPYDLSALTAQISDSVRNIKAKAAVVPQNVGSSDNGAGTYTAQPFSLNSYAVSYLEPFSLYSVQKIVSEAAEEMPEQNRRQLRPDGETAEKKAQYEEYTEQKEKEKREEIKKDVPYKGMERKNLWRLVEMVGLAML